MTIKELREAIAKFDDELDVEICVDGTEWYKSMDIEFVPYEPSCYVHVPFVAIHVDGLE